MTTIKDIAKAAGVAQGTVSNVLNGKGNVSSEKIRQVMDAASALGYVPNERAKLLRKGRSNTLAVILPNIRSKQYIDFYLSFKAYAENHGYSVSQYLTSDDNREAEYAAIQDVRSSMAQGMGSSLLLFLCRRQSLSGRAGYAGGPCGICGNAALPLQPPMQALTITGQEASWL